MEEMDMPCLCSACGELTELNDLNFGTNYCYCGPYEACSHGICDECNAIEERNKRKKK
jgi:hypothetical protein